MSAPVGFIYFFDDMEASEALQFCHDSFFDLTEFFQVGWNIMCFFNYVHFEECRQHCHSKNFSVRSYLYLP